MDVAAATPATTPAEPLQLVADAPADEPKQERKAKVVEPIDAEERARRAEAAKATRFRKAVKEAKGLDDMRRKAAEFLDRPAPKAPEPEQPAPVVAAAPTEEPGQIPGWPKPSEIAKCVPVAAMMWGKAALYLKGTRYDISKPTTVEIDGTKVQVDPVATLTQSTAPVLAKYMPEGLAPEWVLLGTVAMVFGPALLDHALELLGEGDQAQVGATPQGS